MVKLLNDTFDVMNGRHAKEGITVLNWHAKNTILDSMLEVIDLTEENHIPYYYNGKETNMFVSSKTLEGWRLSVRSTIDLVEELFNADYSVVLSAKWNQDALEVIYFKRYLLYYAVKSSCFQHFQRTFGIVRSLDAHPTATSFLRIIRILALYNPAKTDTIKHGFHQ